MKRSAIFTALSLVLTALVFSPTATAEGKRYALIVGVKTYRPGQPLPELPFTENDASDLAKTLEAGGYQVTLMTQTVGRTEGKEVLAPLSDFIRDQLDAMLDNPFLTDEDVVIVALAGHGVQYELIEGDGDNAKKTPKFYFCPGDADIAKLKTANEVADRNRLLDLGELYDALNKCKAGGKLLLVDACRNDPTKPGVTRSLASATLPPLPPPPGGTAAFFSCSAHQKAFEDVELKHGVFFHHVIEALKGDADSSTAKRAADGQITLSELSEHVSSSTYDYVRTKYSGAKQAPELKGEFRLTIPLITGLNGTPSHEPANRIPISIAEISGKWTVSESLVRSPSLPIAQLAITETAPSSFLVSFAITPKKGNGDLLLIVPGTSSNTGSAIVLFPNPSVVALSEKFSSSETEKANANPRATVNVRVVVKGTSIEVFHDDKKQLSTIMRRDTPLPASFRSTSNGLSFVSTKSSFEIANISLENQP